MTCCNWNIDAKVQKCPNTDYFQSKYGKTRTRKYSVFGHFLHSTCLSEKQCFLKYIIFSSLLQLSCSKYQLEKQRFFEVLKSSEYVKSRGLNRVRNKNLFPQKLLYKKLRTNSGN